MLEETNLKEVKDVAVSLLYLDIKIIEEFGICQHPFFSSTLFPFMENKQYVFLDLRNTEQLQKARKVMKEQILKKSMI